MRVARDQRAVAMEHGDRRTLTERDGREEAFELVGIDAPGHDAEKGTVGSAEAVGDYGGRAAGVIGAYRLANNGSEGSAGAQRAEVNAIGDVDIRQGP